MNRQGIGDLLVHLVTGQLAITNLKNNRKSYIPYVLTAILTVMMYYMMANLAANSQMNQEALQIILSLSVHVIEIFALIFLFYTSIFASCGFPIPRM